MFKIAFTFLPFVFAFSLVPLFLKPAGVAGRGKAAALAIFLACASKFAAFRVFGGDAFAPELPQGLIWSWNWAYSGMCILFGFSLAAWPLRLVAKRLLRSESARRVWLSALPAAAAAMSLVGVWNGVRPPDVARLELKFDSLPEELDGYRIVHITDIHASAAARRWRTEEIVRLANSLEADLVCLTGDFADGRSGDEAVNIEPIRNLSAKDGVLAVTGNHEYYFDTPGWEKAYDSWNIRFLRNECVFPRPRLAVAGVSDPACEIAGEPPPDPDAAFSSARNGEFRILLQHRPVVNFMLTTGRTMKEKCDLQLSGHTHGGVAPLMDAVVALFNGGMVRGLYPGGDSRAVYVSPGAGQWAGFPIRFFDDPEITEIVLSRSRPGPRPRRE